METKGEWIGVPDLPDDAVDISSSFISELPLSQVCQQSQPWRTPTSSLIPGREKKNVPLYKPVSGKFRNGQKRTHGFRRPAINEESWNKIDSRPFSCQSQVFKTQQMNSGNHEGDQISMEMPDATAEGIKDGSKWTHQSKPVYQAPIQTVDNITRDYVSPYRPSINNTPENNGLEAVTDKRLALSGRPKKLHFKTSNQNMRTFCTTSTNSDSELEFDSPVSQSRPQRYCFQFSQTQKPDSNNDSDILLQTQIKRQLCSESTHSFLNTSGKEHDEKFFMSTPQVPFRKKNNLDSGFCDFSSPAEALNTPASLYLSNRDKGTTRLRSVEEIPVSYRDVFEFPYFNMVQSLILDDVLYTNKPLVVSAPTGAGKTVILELAIIRLLATLSMTKKNWKIVYVAPMKSLCSERYQDWQKKFQPHGLSCLELTGDTEMDSIAELHKTNLILTTPEKWDSMSRKWKDNRSLFQMIVLFLFDEIHILNDATRGSTVEAVISRMKTLRLAMKNNDSPNMRFVAVSATIPNIEDIATWLGSSMEPASSFNLGEKYRPVRLLKIVVGYPFKDGSSDFRFDMNLAYRLKGIIETYSNNKPTLVFCPSRKSVEQTADVLKKEHYGRSLVKLGNREAVQQASLLIREGKVADMVQIGIGVHHAGLGASDRKQVEDLFRKGLLPVLVSTSTLAMGVNLPAHLVVIKSTVFYNLGTPTEYSDSQVLQMIGRAGRPQFDTSATAVIMTKTTTKTRYENLMNGTQMIESSLHKHLIEHLNAEVVLHTITDMALAVEWIRHTFLYVRVMKNPAHYGYPLGLDRKQVEKRLEDLCLRNLNELAGLKLVTMDPETYAITPTETGKLMARYCIAFDTMKKFHTLEHNEGTKEMLDLIVGCSEFDEFVQLRNNEKSVLNALNKNKNKQTIRYPMNGRIKTKEMKTNCLIQAQLGCLPIQDFSLSQDVLKIFRVGQRVAKCLMELLWQRTDYHSLLTAIELNKSTKTKLWVDSKYVAKQLDGIGPTMSQALVSAGITSFQKMEETDPRELELIVNRHPPFGNQIRDAIAVLPKYELCIEQLKNYKTNSCELVLCISLANREVIQTKKGSRDHQSILLVGDQDNKIVFKWRIIDSVILRDQYWKRRIDVTRSAAGPELYVHLISQEYVGIDIHTTYIPVYQWSSDHMHITSYTNYSRYSGQDKCVPARNRNLDQPNRTTAPTPGRQPGSCQHKCLNKASCRHKCCKDGVNTVMPKQHSAPSKTKSQNRGFEAQLRMLKSKASILDVQPGASKRQRSIGLQQFAYQKPESMKHSEPLAQYEQAPAQFQSRAVSKTTQSTLRNLPVFNYGVGGRRIDPGPNHNQEIPRFEVNIEDFDDDFDAGGLPTSTRIEAPYTEYKVEGGEEFDYSGHFDSGNYQLQENVQLPSHGNHRSSDQFPDTAHVGSLCCFDAGFESDDSLDSLMIQEIPSQYFSQDARTDLHMYQQDGEASFEGEGTVSLQQGLLNTTSEDTRNMYQEENRTERSGRHNSDTRVPTETWQSYLSDADSDMKTTIDFMESNSSDNELCYAEEILNPDSQLCSADKGILAEQSSDYDSYESKLCTADKNCHKGSTSSGFKSKTTNKSPVHRFGQVVAWVADSDSSPLSQKSNPKCKTPVIKKNANTLVLDQKSTSESDLKLNNWDEICVRPLIKIHDDSPVVARSDNLDSKSTSFFHVFKSSKNEDMAELVGNIFAGVF